MLNNFVRCLKHGERVTNFGNNVYIGVNSVILSGVNIGANSVDGAIIPDDMLADVVVGNPARTVNMIKRFHINQAITPQSI